MRSIYDRSPPAPLDLITQTDFDHNTKKKSKYRFGMLPICLFVWRRTIVTAAAITINRVFSSSLAYIFYAHSIFLFVSEVALARMLSIWMLGILRFGTTTMFRSKISTNKQHKYQRWIANWAELAPLAYCVERCLRTEGTTNPFSWRAFE